MANSRGSSNVRNLMYNGRHGLLPPRIPFSSISQSYVDYVPGNMVGSKAVQKPKEGSSHHQRTSSETIVLDEQPSWLDDLLNEPDTPVRKGGHRRSSSDSFAYIDVANCSSVDFLAQDEHRYRNTMPMPMPMPMPIWGSQDFEYHKDARQSSLYADVNIAKPKNRAWDPSFITTSHTGGLSSSRESAVSRSPASAFASHEADALPSSVNDRKDQLESGQHDSKTPTERKDNTQPKSSTSENDSKRAKQQFAQRSRVRKLQYIAELERNVQALQAEGSEFSAELEFLNQQNLILSMENKALKQRLESLAQEHLIKRLEHDVLESEIGRLQTLFQKQKQQQQQLLQSSTGLRRTNSGDLECQLANLSLKQKGANSGRDAVTGSLRIWAPEI